MNATPTDTTSDDDTRSDDDTTSFDDLGLRPELRTALSELGYELPTPIQREAIPALLGGADLLGQAATGTGKTAAFALPLLERLAPGERGPAPVGLVLVPTRELAMQVSEAVHRYGRGLGARVVPLYGGQPIGRQLRVLGAGVDVVVATPGRALDHIRRGTLVLDQAEVVVLDEADEMLDMGFAEDLEAILEATPPTRQTVLFSATMPRRLDAIARRHLREPARIEMGRPEVAAGDEPLVRQSAYLVRRAHKPAALGRVLDMEVPEATIVFCRTRAEVDEVAATMNGRGYRAEGLHGGMGQDERDRVMGRLRQGKTELVVATDVAARGLDVDHLTHVVNYDVPSGPEAYVHRIGRVGRAGRRGVAVTLVEPREHRMLGAIERTTRQPIPLEALPSLNDLHLKKLEQTTAALRERLHDDDHDRFRVVVEALADEFDVVDVALAAIRLAHEATGAGGDEQEIPQATLPADRPKRPRHDERPGRTSPGRGGRPGGRGGSGSGRPTARLFVSGGRDIGMRPQDLVGAIAGETHLSGRDVGAIEISERFSLVEVPEAAAEDVVRALRASTVKGKKVTVRRDRHKS